MKLCPTCRCTSGDEALYCPSDNSHLKPHRSGSQLISGRYFLLRLLGSGGVGAVYQAQDRNLSRECALKLLRVDRDDLDPNGKQRLQQEALIACRIDHRNVVRVYDWGTNVVNADGKVIEEIYVAMELLRGETVQQYLARNGRLTPRDALLVVRQAAQGLAELHAQGVIHRDLKPANLMFTVDSRGRLLVKIIDLGAIKVAGLNAGIGYADLTRGLFIGSPKYASPEMCNHMAVDERSDIYSLGLVLYELLAGRAAFADEAPAVLLYKQVTVTPPRLTGIPTALASLVYDAIEKDPAKRIQSADEFVQRCRELERSLKSSSKAGARIINALRENGFVPVADGVHRGFPAEEETRVSQPPPNAGAGSSTGAGEDPTRIIGTRPRPTGPKSPSDRNSSGNEKRRIARSFSMLTILFISAALLIGQRFVNSTSEADPPVDQINQQETVTEFTGQVGEEAQTTIDCNLRESFSARSKKIGLVEKGSRVRILDQRSNWKRVRILERGREQEDPESENEGWIDGNKLKGVDSPQS